MGETKFGPWDFLKTGPWKIQIYRYFWKLRSLKMIRDIVYFAHSNFVYQITRIPLFSQPKVVRQITDKGRFARSNFPNLLRYRIWLGQK